MVDSDSILPAVKPREQPPPAEVISELPSFEWDKMPRMLTRRIAENALDQAFLMCFDAVSGVIAEQRMGEKDLPQFLQVRAGKDFKAKELVLPPYSTQFCRFAGERTRCRHSEEVHET